jgi:hypothetical protein
VKILFDQGTPAPLRHSLISHEITTAYEMGWDKLSNGDLIFEAERNGFELLITTDQNLRYQQNLVFRKISILVLLTTSWPKIQNEVNQIILEVGKTTIGSYIELKIQ